MKRPGEFLLRDSAQQDEIYGNKSKAFFHNFAQSFFSKHPEDLEVLEHFGITQEHGMNEAVNYDGVLRHSVVEASLAELLAEKLSVSAEKRDLLVRACMLHDVFRRERGEMYDPYAGGRSASETLFDPDAHQGRGIIKKMGVSPEVIELIGAMHSSGAFKLDFNNLEDQKETELVKKIFWYVDSCLDNVKLVSIEDRVKRFRDREGDIDKLGYQLTDAQDRPLNMPLFDYYVNCGKKFEQYLGRKLNIHETISIHELLNDELRAKIDKIN